MTDMPGSPTHRLLRNSFCRQHINNCPTTLMLMATQVEDFVRAKSGYQMMYADSYMTREEFRQMFDHTVYDRLR